MFMPERGFRWACIPIGYIALVENKIFSTVNRKKIENLEKVQKRAARFVFNNYTDRTPGCVTKMVVSFSLFLLLLPI
jgi:hypothetical protein